MFKSGAKLTKKLIKENLILFSDVFPFQSRGIENEKDRFLFTGC